MVEVKLPKIDKRKYKIITLDNNLDVLIISDKETEMSAASVCVNVGYYLDPIPGLAHFLEHMLFMGTKKYPQENYYQDFLKKLSVSFLIWSLFIEFLYHRSKCYLFAIRIQQIMYP